MSCSDRGIGRRAFMAKLPVVSAAATAFATSSCGGLRYALATESGNRLIVSRAEFDTGDYVLVETDRADHPIYLHRGEDGAFTAVLTECTHRGCQPEPSGDRLICPCHGSEFAHDGSVLEGPADRPLRRFAVDVGPDAITISWPEGSS